MSGTVGSREPGLFCISSLKAMVKTSDMTKALSWLGVKREEGQMEGRKDFSTVRGKCPSDRQRVSKNSHAESPVALGVITDVRVGVLAFVQVAEGRKCHWLQGGAGVKPGSSHS